MFIDSLLIFSCRRKLGLNLGWTIMKCRNSEILYVFLFLILFVVANFLLMQYHMKGLSIGKKRSINFRKSSTDLQSKILKDNSNILIQKHGSLMTNKEHHRYRNIYHRKIIEPPITGQKKVKYALNTFYFQKSLNYTIFELM